MGRQPIPEEYLDGYVEMLAEVSTTGRLPRREELEARKDLGEDAARRGYGLRPLVGRILEQTRSAWPDLPGMSGAAGAREARAAGESVLRAVEQVVDAVAAGYERAQLLAVRQEAADRREFIDDLLYGRSDLGHLSARAVRFGLRLARSHVAAVARGPELFDDIHPVTRRVESALTGRFGERRVLLTTKGGRLVCIAPDDQDDVVRYFAEQVRAATGGADCRVAVGRPHPGPGGVVHSYEEALGALELARTMGLDTPVLWASDLLVFPVLSRDREALADLVRTVLGPLAQARGGAGPLLDTLDAYFASGCVSAEAARRIGLSVRALTYRLERVHRLTGADPGDSMQRYTLQTAVIGARLLDWPTKEL
ncbi:PucR family transcriptional regulator [Streptomyces sp. HB2AG]|uniref:PucR family transcriptional regulator n=1 Tax=Streptomyces sp. HB2AG TaxID=2983400 RepID=UPI0022AAE2B8|nr:helix-turn-helix domain-containing protein [Streptomyces sp. HB2AG]MCZ2525989.1 helix-turn-helix domain-containing protein [Streptomyces sp. HB2AG]